MNENIFQKFQRLSKDITKYIMPNASLWKRFTIIVDFLWERGRHNIELIDYIQYQFYFKKRFDRRRFITHGRLLKIIKICNDPESRTIFDQKPLFNQEFKNYLGREFINVADSSREEFDQFMQKHEQIFLKNPDGMFGQGLERISQNEIEDMEAFYIRCVKEKILLEEVLTQCSEFAEFNDTAVNTLRVVTLVCADDTVRIMAGVLRLSRRGAFADNFHHHGLAALIDINTGIVYTQGVDREWNRYVVHPDSEKKIVGYVIPNWNEVLDIVKKAAMVHPEVRYIGWDVTIKANGQIVLIEGNPGSDPDVTQIEDQVGKWPLFEPYINEIKKLKQIKL